MSDGVDDQYKPNLANSLPRAAYEAMQNEKPDPSEIADVLERFGDIEIVREWAIEALRVQKPSHRPRSYKIQVRQLENGLQALKTGSGFLEQDERTTRRDKEFAREYLKLAEDFVDEVRRLIEADKKS